jgi:hypothetical protein
MAMDNELRKILLREQDLRFVTDALGQYLGKKSEERKYYADQSQKERMAIEEARIKAASATEDIPKNKAILLDIKKEDWENPEIANHLLSIGFKQDFTGRDTKYLNDDQIRSVTSLGIDYSGKEDDVSTSSKGQLLQWTNPITKENVVGYKEDLDMFNKNNPNNLISEVYTISSKPKKDKEVVLNQKQRYLDISKISLPANDSEKKELIETLKSKYGIDIINQSGIITPFLNDKQLDEITSLIGNIWIDKEDKKAKDVDKLKKGDLVYFTPNKKVNIEGKEYEAGKQILIPVDKAYAYQKNGSGFIQMTKTDEKSLNWDEKKKLQFTEYKRLRKHLYDNLGIITDPLNPTSALSIRQSLETKYPNKDYEDILKDIIFPDPKEYKMYTDLDKQFSHIWIVEDTSNQKQFQWKNK